MAQRDLRRRFEELSVVAEVASAMLSPLDLDQVLNIAVEKVSRALGARFGSILLLSPDKTILDFAAVYNLTPEYVEAIRRTAPIPADRSSVAGRALQARQPYAVTDVSTCPLFARWRQVAEQEGYRSLICVPLIVGAEAIGTLNLYMTEPHEFHPGEVRLLTVTCQQVCLAIERAHLYEQLKRQHGLERTSSERKSQFLAAMSHELRAPMTAILGFADVLLKQLAGPLNERQKRHLRLISSSAQHLMLLINDALDLAKIEAGKMDWRTEQVDATAIVMEVMEMMSPLAEAKGLTLKWQKPAEPLTLCCDSQKCKQILVNLVSNAIKFTSRGGVKIFGHRDPAQPNVARIRVSDTGVGVLPEDLRLLFQEFQQLDSPYSEPSSGSGLGLSISRKLARLMGGDIEVESSYGKGSTFTLKLEAVA